ncbi:hypothetical protein [Mycoplasmopsis alligatoris]|uniref:Phosphomevalonate kinase n=1 Tax=Mycoplasmopsis alligatoris A21JP2 TaxID=747682 RepID=D4XV83_9BACT|nr:hypothetical protein [Mycoplasmopsis alligatoris]EFF41746.1 conserved hypothetical protein [Mycoplasmopsis alligatoris A21JP2]
MNRHNIVLINGKRRSGKGLLSLEIIKQCNKKYDQIHLFSFAGSIKEIMEPVLKEIEWDQKNKEVVRPLWIALGDVGRKINIDIWTERIFKKILNLAKEAAKQNQNSLFIIDDLRLPNELEFFKANFKEFINNFDLEKNLINLCAIRIEKYIDATKFVPGIDDNSTETAFDKLVNICFDYIIPQNILINEDGIPKFENVSIMAETVIRNYLIK